MNNWVKLIDEYKVHNEMLQEMLKEKNEEISDIKNKMSNKELLDILNERLAEKGFRHPGDRACMFLAEVYEVLEDVDNA